MDALSQAKKLIENSQNILIVPAQPIHGDSLGSCLALFFTLKKLGKNASILIEKFPEKFQFLTNLLPSATKDFVISIDGSEKEISQVRYEKNEKGLKIYLTLDKGEIISQDVSFSTLGQNPDLLIVSDSGAHLDSYQAPILDISNLMKANSSLSEAVTNLIDLMESNQTLVDKNIATCLLTGIICASQNFRHPTTRPQALEISAYLINKGANHQKIIQHLYKQKTISQIKMLGKILEKLSFDEKNEL